MMEDCESGDDLACETLARGGGKARVARKARRGRPSWVQHAAAGAASTAEEEGTSYLAEACDDGDDLACEVLSREEEQARLACPPRPARQLGAAAWPWAAVKSDNA